MRSRYGKLSSDRVDAYSLGHDLYIDFCMNIYDMKTSAKRDYNIPDINIRQYEDGHISTMSVLKSFSVTGQWCITGAFAMFCEPRVPVYLLFWQIPTSVRIMNGEYQMKAPSWGSGLIDVAAQHRLFINGLY